MIFSSTTLNISSGEYKSPYLTKSHAAPPSSRWLRCMLAVMGAIVVCPASIRTSLARPLSVCSGLVPSTSGFAPEMSIMSFGAICASSMCPADNASGLILSIWPNWARSRTTPGVEPNFLIIASAPALILSTIQPVLPDWFNR